MRNFRLITGLLVVGGCGMLQSASIAQTNSAAELSAAQLSAIVTPTVGTCPLTITPAVAGQPNSTGINPAAVIPPTQARAFAMGRIAKTLHGVWRGEVVGDTSDVHVDYFWIIDTRLKEGLIIAQRSGKQTVVGPALVNAPKLTFLMCAHSGYSPGSSTPQTHEFVKISDSTENAAQIVEQATGEKFLKRQPTLADMWQGLVSTGYFDKLNYVAYAGGFFKPMRLQFVKGARGPEEVTLGWDAEYRGGGTTKLEYTTGVPMTGSEQAQFVGTSTTSGDYLVASPGNGNLWTVEVVAGGDYALAFDVVSLGPLQK